MKILVCDDLEFRSEEILAAIRNSGQSDLEVTQLIGADLTKQLEILFDIVKISLGELDRDDPKEPSQFDGIDIVFIDNNLTHLNIKGTRLTAESVAGYVRAFSSAPYIVSLNKNQDVDFDLRFLIGDYATQTDLALNTRHLSNRALWTGAQGDATDGFLPWYWPRLLDVSERRRAQIDFVKDHLDSPILTALEFTPEAIDILSRHATGAISPVAEWGESEETDDRKIGEITFREFFLASSRSFPTKDEREKLAEAADVVARVVASELDHWFRRDVLGPQEALVDMPHLLMRMPFLLGDESGDVDSWNKAVMGNAPPFEIDSKLFEAFLAPCMFRHDIWTLSPAFWWPNLKEKDELNLLFSTSESSWADVVFCEDTSSFQSRGAPNEGSSREFVAEFESPWDRRHVRYLNNIKYAPRSRFAF